jgi:hypothetical protein
MLATSIPAVGKLDPKRLPAAEKANSAYTTEMLDALSAASTSEVASGTDVAASGGVKGKRRVKA